jgi:hypothetical protein
MPRVWRCRPAIVVPLVVAIGASVSIETQGQVDYDPIPTLTRDSSLVLERKLPAGSADATLLFIVPPNPGSRLLVQLRSPVPDYRATLVSATGAALATKIPGAPLVLEGATRHHPERGDLVGFEPVRDPEPGQWTLRIRYPAGATSKTLSATLYLQSRFTVAFSATPVSPRAGEPVLLSLRVFDYGSPMERGIEPEIHVLASGGEGEATVLHPRLGLNNAHGIALTREPGVFLAIFEPPGAGRYELTAVTGLEGVAPQALTLRVR